MRWFSPAAARFMTTAELETSTNGQAAAPERMALMDLVRPLEPTDAPIRLNLGGGGIEMIDRRNGQEAYPLKDYADCSVDEVRASHILEHFHLDEVAKVVREWVRVLKPGGKLKIAVPDFDKAVKAYVEQSDPKAYWYIWGGHVDENDRHFCGFNKARLMQVMRDAGLVALAPWESDVKDCASLPVSLNIEGIKPTYDMLTFALHRRFAGVITRGRLFFSDTMDSAVKTFPSLGITIHTTTGAYFGKGMQTGMERALDEGADWIVTIDHDTLFDKDIMDRLMMLAAANEHADAIVPLQVKRDNELLLASAPNATSVEYFDDDLVEINTGHFGLTLLRADALRRVPKPWFQHKYDDEGSFGEGAIEADVQFWHKWREAGNTLFMAGHVPIGHMQLVATWPGKDFQVIHQYMGEYRQSGPPANVRR